jgi:hypothetical protein
MKNNWFKTASLFVCTSLIFAGCGFPQGANDANNQGDRNNTYGTYGMNNNNPGLAGTWNNGGNGPNDVINEANNNGLNRMFGNSNNGLNLLNNGVTNYGHKGYNSEIGIVRNQGMGISSLLESQLSESGIQGANILFIGDTVILGIKNVETAGTAYRSWDLNEIRSLVQTSLGTGILVLTVTDKNALNAIDRVKRNLNAYSSSKINAISSDLGLILNNAQSMTGTNKGRTNGTKGMDRTNEDQTKSR